VALGVFDEAVDPVVVLERSLEHARRLAAMPADVYARTKLDIRGEAIEAMRAAVPNDPLLAQWVA
jgi:hypothetical protein